MNPLERELLRLLTLHAVWPKCGGREEFETDVKLGRAIEKQYTLIFGNVVSEFCFCGAAAVANGHCANHANFVKLP